MRNSNIAGILAVLVSLSAGCDLGGNRSVSRQIARQLVDTVGFAQYSWQMDSVMKRLDRKGWKKTSGIPWKFVICPHDDYTYVGALYPEILQDIKAPNLILLGVAHKAARLGIEDSLVFDTFKFWKGPWKNVSVSPAREELFDLLAGKCAIRSDSLHKIEHSLEALIPFLQYFNPDVSIIPVLVPAMDPYRMEECGKYLAEAVRVVAKKHKWEWGRDFAIIVTTDAVHYGNMDWGGADMAPFGCDSAGNKKALMLEDEIIKNCLAGSTGPDKIRLFSEYTLRQENYREYKWTWCGRYSIPVALYTSFYLNNAQPVNGEFMGYSTSITGDHLYVDDLLMGRTAIATDCHWVGYATIGYR